MVGPVRLAAAHPRGREWCQQHAVRPLDAQPAVTTVHDAAHGQLGGTVDWRGGVSPDLPDGPICAALVLGHPRVLDHRLAPTAHPTAAPRWPHSGHAARRGLPVGDRAGLWWGAVRLGLPLSTGL